MMNEWKNYKEKQLSFLSSPTSPAKILFSSLHHQIFTLNSQISSCLTQKFRFSSLHFLNITVKEGKRWGRHSWISYSSLSLSLFTLSDLTDTTCYPISSFALSLSLIHSPNISLQLFTCRTFHRQTLWILNKKRLTSWMVGQVTRGCDDTRSIEGKLAIEDDEKEEVREWRESKIPRLVAKIQWLDLTKQSGSQWVESLDPNTFLFYSFTLILLSPLFSPFFKTVQDSDCSV